MFLLTEKNVAECISDDALVHFKSYKYSSVDLSPVSKYVLGPFVRSSYTFSYLARILSSLPVLSDQKFAG
jgi:hypothetical protein